jgi:predicted RNA-binding protein with PIN domain
MPILIDGYNLLRAAQSWLEQTEWAEAELCMLLRDYLRRSRQQGTIIFDGIGPRKKERLQGEGSLQIVFSGQGIEADAVIEQLILENTAAKRLIVVSSDRRISSAAKRRKCQTIKAADFWALICEMTEKPLPVREPKEKQRGIGESETQRWLNVFGLGQKKTGLKRPGS